MSQNPSPEHVLLALGRVLDHIVPERPDGRLPGAGALGLSDDVAEAIGPDAAAGLVSALDGLARENGSADFTSSGAREQTALMNSLESRSPGTLAGIVFQTYALYYRHPRVLATLGVAPRPPWPDGYDLEPGDFSSLEAVRTRGKFYRDAP